MIKATTNIKPLLGNIKRLRITLGKTAQTQGRELAGSAGYIAARYSFPIESGRSNGGGKLTTRPEKSQNTGIYAAISAYWLGGPVKEDQIRRRRGENKDEYQLRKTQTLAQREENISELVKKHPGRVRSGKRISSARRIARFSDERKARFSESAKEELTRRIQKRIGANKAAFVKAGIMIHPLMRSNIPAYINRHIMSADGRAEFFKESDGEYTFILTNYSQAAEALFDRGLYNAAVHSAVNGQIKRYEAEIRKRIKEAKLA